MIKENGHHWNNEIGQSFDWIKAQEYEARSIGSWFKENYQTVLNTYRTIKEKGLKESPLSEFFHDENDWLSFCDYIFDKTCIEIGVAVAGPIAFWTGLKRRILIDPLLDKYRELVLEIIGEESWFTDDIEYYSTKGEFKLQNLIEQIDRAIISRNCLDHCDSPWKVLENLSLYAKTGCYLLLWTDLWHLHGSDEGHRNITKNRNEFADMIRKMGWKILREVNIRNDGSTIEYGCVARKLSSQKIEYESQQSIRMIND